MVAMPKARVPACLAGMTPRGTAFSGGLWLGWLEGLEDSRDSIGRPLGRLGSPLAGFGSTVAPRTFWSTLSCLHQPGRVRRPSAM